MARPTITERARAYVAAMPAAISGSGGHNATFAVACVLVKGFSLSIDQARPLLQEYNQRCDPPWSEKQIEHKLRQADTTADPQPRGYLVGDHRDAEVGGPPGNAPRPAPPPPKAEFDLSRLQDFAGHWARSVDLLWLANRSQVDPATLDSGGFLKTIYGERDKVLCFNRCNKQGQQITQGEALWPVEAPPATGSHGVWFLPQPVDGEFHPNPRSNNNKPSRRSEESCVSFPFLVLESDEAPAREWLGALVQFPLRIAAIYTSGGRSVHALVRVNARTKPEWDAIKAALMPGIRFMMTAGLDRGVLSAVRLSRLPAAFREGKVGSNGYERYERPQLQKLLYVHPSPPARPLIELYPRRDVETDWVTRAAIAGPTPAVMRGLRYYARLSKRLRDSANNLMERA